MIEIKLKEIADRLGKSIMDISRETGLNRNTVTDLYHNKVDGIKFSTLDLLCDTYGLSLADLLYRQEIRIGASPASKIVREIQAASPFFSWFRLNALHAPSATYFDAGVGKIYAFFVRENAELFFDRIEANRCAQSIYRRYSRGGMDEVYAAFIRSRDQLLSSLDTLSSQPLKQFIGTDLIKTFQRACDLYADMLSVSAWLDAFDFGMVDDNVQQMQKAHSFSAADTPILLASGESSISITRRLALLNLAKTFTQQYSKKYSSDQVKIFINDHKDAQRFIQQYPFISNDSLAASLDAYASMPHVLEQELDTLTHLPQRHAKALKAVLQAHGMRANPLAFFSKLTAWREERDEIDLRARFQLERMLRVVAERSHLTYAFAQCLLPQELKHALNGLVTERTLQHRYEQGMLVALEHGEYKVYEGEHAVSVQDDLASRYLSQLEYADIS